MKSNWLGRMCLKCSVFMPSRMLNFNSHTHTYSNVAEMCPPLLHEAIGHHLSYDHIWRIRGKSIRTVLCCTVYDSCAQWYAHHIWALLKDEFWCRFRFSFCAFARFSILHVFCFSLDCLVLVLFAFVMAALCNRGAIIFLPCSFFPSIFFFFFLFFPRLISAAAGWMSTILWHMVWP